MLRNSSVRARLACCAVAALIVLAFFAMPEPQGMTFAAKMSLGLLIAGIVLWVGEPIPFGISGLAIMTCIPLFGILPLSPGSGASVWTEFISSAIFFILASFGLSAALLKTKIPLRIVHTLLRLSKGDAKRIILAFMLSTAAVSLFVSDLPCCALFSGIAVSAILTYEKAKPGESRLGKALMIAIPYAAAVGGQALPSGSSMNVMAIGMLEALTGIHISFLQWAIICTPIALIMLAVAWVSICIVHKPSAVSEDTIAHINALAGLKQPLDALDWKVICIVSITFALWVASNWTGWDATLIALLGLVLLFLPGIDVLDMEEYVACVSWNILLLVGAVQALAGGMKEQGAATWLLNSTVGKAGIGAALPLTALTACMIPLLRLLIPVGPALIVVALPSLCALGVETGITPVFFAVVCAINASTSLMNGLDSISMIAYRYQYWNLFDYLKSGILPTIALAASHALLLMPLMHLAGF